MNSTKIGRRVFNSDILLPGNIDIIFFPLEIFDISILEIFFSIKDDLQKYFLYFLYQNIFFQNQIIIKNDQQIF